MRNILCVGTQWTLDSEVDKELENPEDIVDILRPSYQSIQIYVD